MHRIWYGPSATTTLTTAGETAAYDVSSYSGWVFQVTADLGGSTNVVYRMQSSIDNTNWSTIPYQAGEGNDDEEEIDSAGTVTEIVDDTARNYFFIRSAVGGFKETTQARWFRLYWVSELGGTGASIAMKMLGAWNEEA